MPSEQKMQRIQLKALHDIRKNIYLCLDFIKNLDAESFLKNTEKIYAVVRCLEIISEASRRLPQELRERNAHIPWQDIMSSGNVFRHGYDHLEELELWNTASIDLFPLLKVIEEEIQKHPSDSP